MGYIRVNNIVKYFNVPNGKFLIFQRWKKKKILDNISFKINKGEFIALLGPNGSGKTTIVKILSGILTPEKGKANLFGFTPWEKKRDFLKKIGVFFGNRSNLIFDVPIMDSLLLFKEIYEIEDNLFKERVNKLSSKLGIEHLLDMPVRKLSFGQRIRAELLLVFLHKPELVILDEPTIGLDPIVKYEIRKFLKDRNKREKTTIILTTHNIEDVEYLCERAILIEDGKVIWDGKLENLKEKYIKFKYIEFEIPQGYEREAKRISKKYGIKVIGNMGKGKLKKDSETKFLKEILSKIDLVTLNIREPNLEEIIMQIYKG